MRWFGLFFALLLLLSHGGAVATVNFKSSVMQGDGIVAIANHRELQGNSVRQCRQGCKPDCNAQHTKKKKRKKCIKRCKKQCKKSPSPPPLEDDGRRCCTWDFVNCGGEESAWCNESAENCFECDGFYIAPSLNTQCTKRWDGCSAGSCCNSLSRTASCADGYCDVSHCCSWDLKTCAFEDENGEYQFWCHRSQENCEGACDGKFIERVHFDGTCLGRWDSSCTSDDDCCPLMTCAPQDGGSWQMCDYDPFERRKPGDGQGQEPSPNPPGPEPAPEPAPQPNPQPAPQPVPQPNPQPAPQPAPQPTPTNNLPPIPSGPYVTKETSSESVVIRSPPQPELSDQSFSCPHDQSNLLEWTSDSTWGGTAPQRGRNVQIPTATKVILRTGFVDVGRITIPASSELVLGDNNPNSSLHLRTTGIDVNGKLTSGADSCTLRSFVHIELVGSRPSNVVTNVPAPVVKGISVAGPEAILSLHGKRFFPTWTRLAKTVQPGDQVILLQDSVNWEAGQEIVLITTALKDSKEWHQNEVREILAVENNPVNNVGAAVYLTNAVDYQHLALDRAYQGEVGLLSRNILVAGSADDSDPTDPDPLNCRGSRWIYGTYEQPCFDRDLTGYGGHIIVHAGGRGFVEGVELNRMGQTNALGRYPMHFHILQDGCDGCYFKYSSVHRSFYRCVSIHGTNGIEVTQNVAYSVTGFCYYLEDGVEENNVISYNLAAHIHSLEDAPNGGGQTTNIYQQHDELTLPADVTAAGFYITNVHNDLIGNAASGGWAGFAFPNLPTAIGPHRNTPNFRPSSVTSKVMDSNTVHSTGWWWYHTGGFYFGGALYFIGNDRLEYNPGRSFDFSNHGRRPCEINACEAGDCVWGCPQESQAWLRLSNSKAFLIPGPGLNSWSGRMEIIGFETHDVGLSIEALESGFFIDDMLAVCRTGEPIVMPEGGSATYFSGDGFFWYDTDQEHIITRSTFRNCGYRSNQFNQYDNSPDRGCGDDAETGCNPRSTVFGFLTHSDQFNPELMQGTRDITFEDCGRRFYLSNFRGDDEPSTVSGRLQNWVDVDGSVSGFFEPTLIGSGLDDARYWWEVDDEVVYDPQGPLRFIKKNNGPERNMGHFRILWDETEHNKVGSSVCGNGSGADCPSLGTIRHLGPKFQTLPGLPVTASSDIAGPTGGFGWLLELNRGPPKSARFELIEVDPSSPMLLSIPYPRGTSFTIVAHAAWCSPDNTYSCEETFSSVSSVQAVRQSLGNTYHVDNNGLLTFRIVATAQNFVGQPEWFLPGYDDVGKWGSGFALPRFERGGVLLPGLSYGPYLSLEADCGSSGGYCTGNVPNANPNVCPSGMRQVSYDKCCSSNSCVFANGNSE